MNPLESAEETTDAQVLEHWLASGEMLASQMPEASSWSPEKRLAAAVLTSALISIREHHGESAHARQVRADLDWIASDDVRAPYCFLRLCDVFGLDPAWVRASVARWRRQPKRARTPFSMHRHAA